MKDEKTLDEYLTDDESVIVRALGAIDNENYASLVHALNLDPTHDFRYSNLSEFDFSNADLRGADFTGADLRGAVGTNYQTDATTILTGADVDNSTFAHSARQDKYASSTN